MRVNGREKMSCVEYVELAVLSDVIGMAEARASAAPSAVSDAAAAALLVLPACIRQSARSRRLRCINCIPPRRFNLKRHSFLHANGRVIAAQQHEASVVEAIGKLGQLHGSANLAEFVGALGVTAHFFAVEIKNNEAIVGGVEMRNDV